jgi:hypothetical protein
MRGRRPSPLDDSGAKSLGTEASKARGSVPSRPGPRAHAAGAVRPGPALCDIFASARGCGGIGRRARFRSVSGQPGGGSSPLIRIGEPPPTAVRRLAAVGAEQKSSRGSSVTDVAEEAGESSDEAARVVALDVVASRLDPAPARRRARARSADAAAAGRRSGSPGASPARTGRSHRAERRPPPGARLVRRTRTGGETAPRWRRSAPPARVRGSRKAPARGAGRLPRRPLDARSARRRAHRSAPRSRRRRCGRSRSRRRRGSEPTPRHLERAARVRARAAATSALKLLWSRTEK